MRKLQILTFLPRWTLGRVGASLLAAAALQFSIASLRAEPTRWLVPGVSQAGGGAFQSPFWMETIASPKPVSLQAATKACVSRGMQLPDAQQISAVLGPARPLLALPGLEGPNAVFSWPDESREWIAAAASSAAGKRPFRCSKPASKAELAQELQRLIAAFPGTTAVYAKNLTTGEHFAFREKEKVRTASTVKLPILVGLAQLIADGQASWEETIALTPEDRVSGSGVLREFNDGTKHSLRDLSHLMIVVSDNTATNLLLDRVTANRVNQVMDKYGFPNLRSNRKIMGDGKSLKPNPGGNSDFSLIGDNKKYGIGMATAEEMAGLLEALHNGKIVSAQASAQIVAILQRQQYTDAIGRHLDGFTIASKSGALDALRSDVAILKGKQATLVMALTVDGMKQTDYSPDNLGNLYLSRIAGLLVGLLGPL